MSLAIVGYLIAAPLLRSHDTAVVEGGNEFSIKNEEDMALVTPMIRRVAGGVLHPADTDWTEVQGAPEGFTGIAGVPGGRNGAPVDGAKGESLHFHGFYAIGVSPVKVLPLGAR
jgi:hypothetical protein